MDLALAKLLADALNRVVEYMSLAVASVSPVVAAESPAAEFANQAAESERQAVAVARSIAAPAVRDRDQTIGVFRSVCHVSKTCRYLPACKGFVVRVISQMDGAIRILGLTRALISVVVRRW